PFVVALNKIDKISGWQKTNHVGRKRIESQPSRAREIFDEKVYEIIGTLFDEGFKAELYYNITDFQRTLSIVPISSKTGEGIPELLMTVVGLAQRFLEQQLHIEKGPAKGTVLEVKEEIGLGTTIDTIIYNGVLTINDTIVVGTKDEPVVTTIKALLKPKPLDEIRDPRERFDSVEEVHAACGIKISSPNLENVVPGAPLRAVKDNLEEVIEEVRKQTKIEFELDEDGIIIKADTIGSLEALIKESRDKGIAIRKADIGNVSKRDIIEADATQDPLNKVIFAFNVKVLPEAQEELQGKNIAVFREDVIYTIMEKYDEWLEKTKEALEKARREEYVHPGMIRILPEYIFRVSNPAIVGVRVLAGRIREGITLMREDGRLVGKIRGIQSQNKPLEEAKQGEEVAISIDGVTVGRQIKGGDILYTDIPARDAKKLREMDVLTIDERDVLEKIYEIKRKTDKFWGI
ncbi:MAG TPA: translation initiation factor IF-2, partial [Thermoplasmatales archaeon]|nr:translation initiation factor IF-2 [Thermoplasmatales archaeon]